MNLLSKKEFSNPAADFRPICFWSLNDRLESATMRAHVRQMKAGGWGGSFMHSRGGLATAYMGPEWMNALSAAIDESEKLGLKAWIYDEDGWPSGYAGGMPELNNPAIRQRVLLRLPKNQPLASHQKELFRQGEWVYCEHVMELGLGSGSAFNGTAYIDLLNPRAVQAFIKNGYEPYYARFKAHFGKTIPGIFMDEPEVVCRHWFPRPSLPWTFNLETLFKQAWGYDLTPLIPQLFENSPCSGRVRYHFWRLIDTRLAESFNKQLFTWCEKHGVQSTGHMTCEESLYSQLDWSGTTMASYPWFHIPGVDMLNKKTDEVLTLKQCVSVARQTGKKRILSEMFGLAGQSATFEDLKWIGDWHMALGINFFCFHLANYSMRGMRKRDCPPNLFFQQPYFEHMKKLSDYFARACTVLSCGKAVVDVAVIHPIESAWINFYPESQGSVFQHDHPSTHSLQQSIYRLSENLLSRQIDFDYCAERFIPESGSVKKGRLIIGKSSYRIVILPELQSIRQTTLDLLCLFAKQGGTIIAAGSLPECIEGHPDPLLAKALKAISTPCKNKPDEIERLVGLSLQSTIVFTKKNKWDTVLTHTRTLPDRTVIFCTNNSRLTIAMADLTVNDVSALHSPVVWDCTTGKQLSCAYTRRQQSLTIPIMLHPGESILLDIGKQGDRAMAPLITHRSKTGKPVFIDGPWQITTSTPNILPLEQCSYKLQGDTRFKGPIAVLKLQDQLIKSGYTGSFQVRFEFNNQATAISEFFVVVESAEQFCLMVNGQGISTKNATRWIDDALKIIDISSAIVCGRNIVELTGTFTAQQVWAPLKKPRHTGTELEQIYILGNFGVKPAAEVVLQEDSGIADCAGLPNQHYKMYNGPFEIVDKNKSAVGDLTACGYPFFSGTIQLSQEFVWNKTGQGAIKLTQWAGCSAKILLNNVELDTITWAPYQVSTKGNLRRGKNIVTIELSNTLRNALGPFHTTFEQEVGLCYLAHSKFSDFKKKQPTTESNVDQNQFRVVGFGILGAVEIVG